MMELLSYGNLIHNGKYNLHSKFKSSVNFIAGDSFVFVVNETVSSGPLNIVVRGIDLQTVYSLEIINDRVNLGGAEFNVDEAIVFNSSFSVDGSDYGRLLNNLELFENAVKALAPAKSLTFLIDREKLAEFQSSFELEYIKRIQTGVAEIISGNILSGVNAIKGLGPGLTPSGDDFNSGLLISLNLAQKILGEDLSSFINSIYKSAKGNNPFTNAFLLSSAKGLLSEKFKKLLYAILYNGYDEILENTKPLLTIGETSGIDQAVGFLIGAKRFLI